MDNFFYHFLIIYTFRDKPIIYSELIVHCLCAISIRPFCSHFQIIEGLQGDKAAAHAQQPRLPLHSFSHWYCVHGKS